MCAGLHQAETGSAIPGGPNNDVRTKKSIQRFKLTNLILVSDLAITENDEMAFLEGKKMMILFLRAYTCTSLSLNTCKYKLLLLEVITDQCSVLDLKLFLAVG